MLNQSRTTSAPHSSVGRIPAAPDSETTAWLRLFLTPIVERAQSWVELREALAFKGYDLVFRAGRMVIMDTTTQKAICCGASLGTPLRDLSIRLGRPAVRLMSDGQSAVLKA